MCLLPHCFCIKTYVMDCTIHKKLHCYIQKMDNQINKTQDETSMLFLHYLIPQMECSIFWENQ